MRYRRSIHWFRRDLRLADNPALRAAVGASAEVVPLYITSVWKDRHRWTGPGRQEFLCGCLAALDRDLRAAGGRLVVRAGAAVGVLRELIRETRAEALFFNRAVDPFGRATDQAVRALCRETGIECHDHNDAVLHEPGEVLTAAGTPFRVFTPYCRAWVKLAPPAPSAKVRSLVSPAVRSLPLPRLQDWGWREGLAARHRLEAGEAAARQRLRQALAGPVPRYAQDRDLPAGRTTSRLSQDLRFGLLSIRELVARVIAGMRGAPTADERASHEVFLKELAWREFYLQILHHFPEVLEVEFDAATRGVGDQGGHGVGPEILRKSEPAGQQGFQRRQRAGHFHNRQFQAGRAGFGAVLPAGGDESVHGGLARVHREEVDRRAVRPLQPG